MSRVALALPLLVIALVTVLAVGVSLRFVRLFFGSMARGETTVGWITPGPGRADQHPVRSGIVLVTLVVAAPLVTGTDDGTLSRAGVKYPRRHRPWPRPRCSPAPRPASP